MKKRLKVKNDFIFQRIFGRQENKDILISLLNAILCEDEANKIEDIQIIENTKLDKDRMEEKQGILDVRAKLINGTQVNIEIQLVNQYNMDKRTLFYWSKLYIEQINTGQPFEVLNKTITINILDFNYIKLDEYHTKFHLREEKHNEYMLTDIEEIHFIELTKFRKHRPDIEKPLERWLMFMETTSEEVLEMIGEKDPNIKKAEAILDWLGTDEETIRQYERREMQIHDDITRITGAKEEGRMLGIVEGKQLGMVEGKQLGRKEGMLEVVKNMLLSNMDFQIIRNVTGLSDKEIEEIKNRIN